MPLYLITSPTGKQYVGITTLTVNRRMTGHKTGARLGSPYPLHAAIRKYGFDKMVVETLHPSRDLEELHALEIATIARLNTMVPNGYNLTAGGEGTIGHVVSDEHRLVISERLSKKWKDPEFAAACKARSVEQGRLSMSDPEHLAKIEAGQKAYWTEEARAERAKATGERQKIAWADPEYRAKHSARLVAMNKDPEKRAAVSAAAKVTRAKQSPERRKEIAMLAVETRNKKRAEREAYLLTLPPEEAARLRAEATAKKSAETKAGRAAVSPERKAASSERYRQAALRRDSETIEKMKTARAETIAAKRERIA